MLGTRLYLRMMDYPIIGRGRWHIGHVIWGGLAMTTSMILILVFENKKINKLAAGMFGVGLGWFVDEIGKFLSRDNNYFFQPAIIFMYLFFVLLFLLYRFLENRDDDRDEDNGVAEIVWQKFKHFGYRHIFRRKVTLIILTIIAGIYTLSNISDLWYILANFKNDSLGINTLSLKAMSDVLVSIFFGWGLVGVIQKKYLDGIKRFQVGLMIYIFLTSIFKFYFEQFGAVFGLATSVVIYYGLGRLRLEFRGEK